MARGGADLARVVAKAACMKTRRPGVGRPGLRGATRQRAKARARARTIGTAAVGTLVMARAVAGTGKRRSGLKARARAKRARTRPETRKSRPGAVRAQRPAARVNHRRAMLPRASQTTPWRSSALNGLSQRRTWMTSSWTLLTTDS